MRFLSQTQAPLPSLTVTRKRRKMIVNQISQVITVYETETKIELSLPSIFNGIRDTFRRIGDTLAGLFLPKVYAL